MLSSCKGENDLEQVQIPDPEVETTQLAYGNPGDVKVNEGGTFKMKGLKYAYDALESYIDAKTMEIHHTKHHQTYVNKLNEALDKHSELHDRNLEDLLRNLNTVPEDIRKRWDPVAGPLLPRR